MLDLPSIIALSISGFVVICAVVFVIIHQLKMKNRSKGRINASSTRLQESIELAQQTERPRVNTKEETVQPSARKTFNPSWINGALSAESHSTGNSGDTTTATYSVRDTGDLI
jgi:hypothetical protein